MKTLAQLLLALLFFPFFACEQESTPPDVVVVFSVDATIEGIIPYTWLGNPLLIPGLDGKMAGLAMDNTLFQVADTSDSDTYFYLYKAAHGNAVTLRAENDLLFADGKLHSAYWDEENHETVAGHIDRISDEDLASINLLFIDLNDSSRVAPTLSRIIRVNPGIVIFTKGASDQIQDLIASTQPELLLIDNQLFQDPSQTDLSRIRSLVFRKSTSSLNQLKGLEFPALESFCLFITEMDTTEFFLPEYPQVSSLSFMTGFPASHLSAYSKLHALCLLVNDTTYSLDDLPHPDMLHTLSLSGHLDDLKGIERVRNLRNLRLIYGEEDGDSATCQSLLDTLIMNNPDLFYLDISQANIHSLELLRVSNQLRYLALPSAKRLSSMNLEALRELPKLAYIGIFRENDEGEEEILKFILTELRAICPNCSIYYHEGFCLGRGWLLLLLPLLLLLLAVKKWL